MNQKNKHIYIIGAGITGLSAAYCLADHNNDYQITVFEQGNEIGGMASTFLRDDMFLDLGPHKFFSNLKDREKEVLSLIGKKNLLTIKKRSQIRLLNKFIDFPIGPIDVLKINPLVGIQMGLSYAWSILRRLVMQSREKSYEDYLKNRFGVVAYNLTFAPYAKKIWADPTKLDKELASTRVASPSLFEIIKQMIFKIKSKSTEISAEYFSYPKMGSGIFGDKLKEKIIQQGGLIKLKSNFEGIRFSKNKVTSIFINKEEIKIKKDDVVISTIPIEMLYQRNEKLVVNLENTISKLKYRNMILVYIVVNRNRISNQNWYFFPESKYVFNRVFEQKSFSHYMIPQNKTVLCCEITCDSKDTIWNENQDNQTSDLVIEQLVECGLISKNEVLNSFTRRINRAYPIYNVGIRGLLDKIFRKLDSFDNFYSIGRQGGFNYVGMIDCFDIGKKTADFILKKSKFVDRKSLRNSFFDYIVID